MCVKYRNKMASFLNVYVISLEVNSKVSCISHWKMMSIYNEDLSHI